ncbi:hypothetical protein VTN02DRAFT_6154 [Thermoascus thermophilus]
MDVPPSERAGKRAKHGPQSRAEIRARPCRRGCLTGRSGQPLAEADQSKVEGDRIIAADGPAPASLGCAMKALCGLGALTPRLGAPSVRYRLQVSSLSNTLRSLRPVHSQHSCARVRRHPQHSKGFPRHQRATMTLTRSSDPLVWIDCEMTGLDPETDQILQICCFITDAQLRLLEPNGFEAVIHHPRSTLDAMSPWCVDTHGRTGLTAAVLASTTTPAAAAADLLAYIQRHVPAPRTALLAGNSVHADRAFLSRGPYAQVLEYLHYRILDVSAIKEAVRRWGSEELLRDAPPKREVHLARDDILESIAEMRYYREKLFGGR